MADFTQQYSLWQNQSANYKATTAVLDGLLGQAQEKLARFDVLVQVHFMAGTPQYTSLFPKGRSAMYTGGKDENIQSLTAFASALAAFAPLASVKADVDAFVADLAAARSKQQQHEQEVQHTAGLLKAAQGVLTKNMYRNLGALMELYYEDTAQITNFYQLDVIRNVQGAGDIVDGEG